MQLRELEVLEKVAVSSKLNVAPVATRTPRSHRITRRG